VLKPGANRLEFKVTNQWTNRQLGDRSVPPERRVLASGSQGPRLGGGGFGPSQTLPESGLLGPIRVVSMRER
jgi:hypothetical protein